MKLVGQLRARLGLDKSKFDKGLKGAKKGANKFGSAVKKIGGIIAAAFAVTKIVQWAKALKNAYQVQKEGELKLATVVKQRMGLGKAAVKDLLKQASAYQKIGIIGDEIQIAGMQQLATFVKQKKSLENLMPAMNNLLAQQKGYNAQAGDAVNIANMMGRVLTGQVSALSRVGISFTEVQKEILKTGNELEVTATLSEIITDNVGNMNEELAKTDLGKIQTFRNLWGDLKEWLGSHIVPGLAKAAVLFSKLITPKASVALKREQEELNLLIGVITDELTLKKDRIVLIQRLNTEYSDFLGNLEAEKVTNKELADRLKEVNAEYNKKIAIAIKEELIGKKKAKLARLFEKQLKQQNTITRIQTLIDEERFTELERNYGRNLRNAKNKVLSLQAERQEIYNVVAATMKLVEAELKLLDVGKSDGDDKGITAPGRPSAPGKIAPLGGTTAELLGLTEQLTQSTDIQTTALANMNSVLERNIELHERFAEILRITAKEQLHNSLMNEFYAGTSMALSSEQLKSAKNTGQAIEMIGKAMANAARESIKAALAETVANAIASVFKTVPFPLNLALAAAAGAGAMSLFNAAIPEFAGGGIVPAGYPGDTYPALLSSGETVTPPGKLPQNQSRRNQKVEFIIEKDQLVGILEMYNNQINNF